MPTPKKFDKPMKAQILVMLPDFQVNQIHHLEELTGMGSADIMRAALQDFYAKVYDQTAESGKGAAIYGQTPATKTS